MRYLTLPAANTALSTDFRAINRISRFYCDNRMTPRALLSERRRMHRPSRSPAAGAVTAATSYAPAVTSCVPVRGYAPGAVALYASARRSIGARACTRGRSVVYAPASPWRLSTAGSQPHAAADGGKLTVAFCVTCMPNVLGMLPMNKHAVYQCEQTNSIVYCVHTTH